MLPAHHVTHGFWEGICGMPFVTSECSFLHLLDAISWFVSSNCSVVIEYYLYNHMWSETPEVDASSSSWASHIVLQSIPAEMYQ